MTILRGVLFGAGSMGANHARVITQSSIATLGLVIDPNALRGKSLANKYNASWQPHVDSLKDFDFAVVASPTIMHFENAVNALDNQLPTLVEKPIDEDFSRIQELVSISEKANVPFICGLVERFNPVFMTIQKITEEIKSIYAIRHSPYLERATGNIAGDLMIHDLDLILNLFSSYPEKLLSHCFDSSIPSKGKFDSGVAICVFDDNRYAHVSASRMSHRKIRTLSITEKNRLIEADLIRRSITIFKSVSEDTSFNNLGYRQQSIMEIPELVSNKEPLVAQFDFFANAVLRSDNEILNQSLVSTLKTHRLISEII
jgi:predicted dehydrogenase